MNDFVPTWFGGRNVTQDMSGEYRAISGHSFEKCLTPWECPYRVVCYLSLYGDSYHATIEVNCRRVLDVHRGKRTTTIKALLEELDVFLTPSLVMLAIREFMRQSRITLYDHLGDEAFGVYWLGTDTPVPVGRYLYLQDGKYGKWRVYERTIWGCSDGPANDANWTERVEKKLLGNMCSGRL